MKVGWRGLKKRKRELGKVESGSGLGNDGVIWLILVRIVSFDLVEI